MKPLILFRFHKQFDVCLQNLRLLRRMNPGVPVHGLYGGFGGVAALPKDLGAAFDTVRALPFEDPLYNWKNGDLCVRWWHQKVGKGLAFSHLAVVEWDMLYLHPLAQIYAGFGTAANSVSMLGPYPKLLADGWVWIQGSLAGQVTALCERIAAEGRAVAIETLSFGTFGGCVLCRAFLDRYVQQSVPSYSNDEVRLALYSASFGIPLIDTGFQSDKRNWINDVEGDLTAADLDTVIARGGHVIHPIRRIIPGLAARLGQDMLQEISFSGD